MLDKAIVLVSGGMDSCVTASYAKKDGYSLAFLHVNYGQRTEKKELEAFNNLGDSFNVKDRLIVDMKYLSKIGGSCLTDYNIKVPKGNLNNDEIPISYVPFRNANILSAAVSWGEIIEAKAIYIGAVEEDSSGYPDCRKSFYESFNNSINEGTKPETNIKIVTPLINLTKKEIIKTGKRLQSPLHLTWSCYESINTPCLKCDSCLLRIKGFKEAKITDPILNKT